MAVRVDYSNCMASCIGAQGFADESLAENQSVLVSALESLRSREESGEAGFLHPVRPGEIKEILDFVEETSSDTEDIAVLGVGGGITGARALVRAWSHPMALEGKRVPRVHFFESVDPDTVSAIRYGFASPASTQIHVVGDVRGGEAIASVCGVIRQWLRREHLSPRNHLVLYADPGCGLLLEFAKREGARVFPIPRGVQGPWNILTTAAMVPSAFVEFDFRHFLEGIRQMSLRCRGALLNENPAAVLAHLWNSRLPRLVPSASGLSDLVYWFYALQEEVLEPVRDSLPLFLTVDHPRVDYRIDGDHGTTLSQVVRDQQQALAATLASAGRPSATIGIDRVREGDVGALVFLLLFATALAREARLAVSLQQQSGQALIPTAAARRYVV